MTLLEKERDELIKLFYLGAENAVDGVRVYRWNQKLKRGPCFIKSVLNLLKKFEEMGCTCDRSRFRRSCVPFEVVAEEHNGALDGYRCIG